MKNTVVTFQEAKNKGEKLSMLTAYDYSTAKLIDEAGVNAILVGDSLGMVVLGYEDTLSVTMEDMIHHSAAVAGDKKGKFFIGLSDILQALAFAEDEEKIPEIPQEWWEEIGKLYSA